MDETGPVSFLVDILLCTAHHKHVISVRTPTQQDTDFSIYAIESLFTTSRSCFASFRGYFDTSDFFQEVNIAYGTQLRSYLLIQSSAAKLQGLVVSCPLQRPKTTSEKIYCLRIHCATARKDAGSLVERVGLAESQAKGNDKALRQTPQHEGSRFRRFHPSPLSAR